jgi:hypothetical protein
VKTPGTITFRSGSVLAGYERAMAQIIRKPGFWLAVAAVVIVVALIVLVGGGGGGGY